jgi:hypothetical protein
MEEENTEESQIDEELQIRPIPAYKLAWGENNKHRFNNKDSLSLWRQRQRNKWITKETRRVERVKLLRRIAKLEEKMEFLEGYFYVTK